MPVVVGQIAADQREHRILLGGQNVVGDDVVVGAAIAARNKLERIGGFGRHGAEAAHGGIVANAELVLGPWCQAGQFRAEHA